MEKSDFSIIHSQPHNLGHVNMLSQLFSQNGPNKMRHGHMNRSMKNDDDDDKS